MNSGDGDDVEEGTLIPGLPDDVAEICLLRVPYPYQPLISAVSSPWNKAISSPSFSLRKNSLSLSLPYLFVLAYNERTAEIRWQALDPRSGCWFLLPPMPLCSTDPQQYTSAALEGKLVVFRAGGRTLVYHAPSNSWSVVSPTRSSAAVGSLDGKIYAVGGGGSSAFHVYDWETDTWTMLAKMRRRLRKYDAAVIGGKLFLTEGWRWPCDASPRADVYDPDDDTWREMPYGMREGWTGLSAVVGDRLLVVTEYVDCLVKEYDFVRDTWHNLEGDNFPCDTVRRPFSVRAAEDVVYVASRNLHVAIGKVSEMEHGRNRVAWSMVEAPKEFSDFSPISSQILYA